MICNNKPNLNFYFNLYRIFKTNSNSDLKVICDKTSFSIIQDAKLDYSKELIGSSFRIIDNPEAASGCGCGVSFDLKNKLK